MQINIVDINKNDKSQISSLLILSCGEKNINANSPIERISPILKLMPENRVTNKNLSGLIVRR